MTIPMVAAIGVPVGVAGQQDEYPPALPREGAMLTFGNEFVDAWDVTWTVDSPTPMHRHVFDYLGVELTASRTLLTSPGGGTRTVSLDRGRVWFLTKGTTHAETGLTDDPPRRAIIVELKDTVPARIGNETAFPSGPVAGTRTPVIDNERVLIWDVTWSEARPEPARFYTHAVVFMFLDDAELEWSEPGGATERREYKAGQVQFIAAGQARAVRSRQGSVRVIVVELKEGK